MGKSTLRKALILGFSTVALGATGFGVRNAMRSPMFTLQVVEIADLPDNSPVDAQALTQLAAVPVGRVNLFDLDLKPIEARIVSHPWIREVRLEKHFPQTLSVSVTFREPQALIQSESGALAYVDVDGRVFGQVDLRVQPDLPVFSASMREGKDATEHIRAALRLVHAWERSDLGKTSRLSQLEWDGERGFRALVSYPLAPAQSRPGGAKADGPSGPGARGRAFVDLGQDLDAGSAKPQLERLSRVFEYLTAHRVLSRQIWADAGKKIVVKTARGS
jgi:hypothetical protein